MSGLTWFELDVDFPDHPKTIELCTRLRDPNAGMYVVRIWRYCYKHARDRFSGEAAVTTIEQAAAWRGKRGRLVETLRDVGFLEEEAGEGPSALVIHGIGERLGPHLAKREAERARSQERRDAAARGIHTRETRARTPHGRPPVDRPYTDKDIDKTETEQRHKPDPVVSDPGIGAEPPPPPPGGSGLESICERLARAQGLPRVSVGTGPQAALVPRSFGRWLRLAGEDVLVAECLRIARDKHQVVGHLSWFPGFLDSAPDDALRAAAGSRNGVGS